MSILRMPAEWAPLIRTKGDTAGLLHGTGTASRGGSGSNPGRVRAAASISGLSAVGWGLLYPDLLPTFPELQLMTAFPGFRNMDRGWALDNDWRRNWSLDLRTTAPTLEEWMRDGDNALVDDS
jgi:hypothetical protein